MLKMLYSNTIGKGKDLVLLHGWGFNSALFNQLIEQYKNQYRITTIDLPGHGKSDNVDGGLEQWSEEIIKILPQNPILLGWSLGGLLAINIANKVPVSELILVASTPKFVQSNDWQYGIKQANFKQFSDTLQLNPSKGLKRFVSLQTRDKSQLKSLNQSIDQYPASMQSLNQGLTILLSSDLINQLSCLSLPIKVILGRKDTLVPMQIEQWYLAKNISVQLLNTGHLPFLDKEFSL
mgnify:CR=1 FL=1